jgi:hypothetical protein
MRITPGVIAILISAVVALAIGSVVIIMTGKDPTSYVGSVGVLFTTVAAFVVTIKSQQKQEEKIEVVRKQTNGNLTKLQVEKMLAEKQLRRALAQLHPKEAHDILDDTLSHDEVMKLVAERNSEITN